MKELVIRVTQDSFDKTSRWLEVSHNGGAAWSTVLIHNDEEALQIIHALQQSVQRTCAYCGAEDDKHALDCWVAHNQLPNASR